MTDCWKINRNMVEEFPQPTSILLKNENANTKFHEVGIECCHFT